MIPHTRQKKSNFYIHMEDIIRKNIRERQGRAENTLPSWLPTFSQYQEARLALHNSPIENVLGREREISLLQEVLQRHLENERSYFLCISGLPGTGKTTCVFKVIQQLEVKSNIQIVYVDCTTTKTTNGFYMKIIQQLPSIELKKPMMRKECIIKEYLRSEHKMLLLVLDKIDRLWKRELYAISEWPSLPNSKLILFTITNVPASRSKILPIFESRCILEPISMHFKPYTKQQRFNIISAKLNQANASDVFTPFAIQMLAGKIALLFGDIRQHLDISRRVVELAESHKIAQVLCPNNNNGTNMHTLKQQRDMMEINKTIDTKKADRLLNEIYDEIYDELRNFYDQDAYPLQQTLLLCSFVLILNKEKNEDVTFKRLQEVYRKVCKKRDVCAVDSVEFVRLCLLSEAQGILRIMDKKKPHLSKVSIQWDWGGWQENLDLVQDKNMIIEILDDTSYLE